MSDSQPNDPATSAGNDLGVHQAARLEKLKKIEALGLDPWGQRFDNRLFIEQVRGKASEVQFRKSDGS